MESGFRGGRFPRPKRGLVHIASINWDWWWARQQQLTERLSRDWKTIFVEQMLSIDGAILRARLFHRYGPNLWILSPFKLLPFESKLPFLYAINRYFFAVLVRLAMIATGIENPILLFSTYDSHGLLSRISHALVVYDCLDLHESFPWATGVEPALERELIRQADVVIASAPQLVSKLVREGVAAVLIRNAADVRFFQKARESGPIHPKIERLPPPRIGFVGYVADHVDLDLLDYVACERPGWSLLLVGRRSVRDHVLFSRPNVTYVGEIPYAEIPAVLRGLDVCLIPFKKGPLTDAADTIKLYEYLSAGKQVVSTGISQAREFVQFIGVADTPEDFLHEIEARLSASSSIDTLSLDRILSESDWDARTRVLEGVMEEALARKEVRSNYSSPP